MAQKLPVYDLQAFQEAEKSPDFYANRLKPHVAAHTFTNLPHKHDFYLVMLVTKGSGTHEIDFEKYTVAPGAVFIMKPGQMHFWKLSGDIDGFVFFHSRTFFEEAYFSNRQGLSVSALQEFPFFNTSQNTPYLKISKKNRPALKTLMQQILDEHLNQKTFKIQQLRALVNLVYIALSREYKPVTVLRNQTYLNKALAFEHLIEQHFKDIKSAGEYAARLNITEKHLNRITQSCFNKTSTQLIAGRIVLEAKRMLMHTGLNVTEIADLLGYSDTSYFVRFFKKNAGQTPLAFLNKYKEN
jgi:AraC family transcriptional regulator, transcriptional activator of pobA